MINSIKTQYSKQTTSNGRISLFNYGLILLQLGLVTLLIRQYAIESAAFLQLFILAFAGFAIHALLPLSYRLPFFLLISLAGIVVTLDIVNGTSLIAIGLILIGICHLPFSFRIRGILLLVVGSILIAFRAKWVEGPISEAIWPILGSMFMFRLITYFYDLRHDNSSASLSQRLAYFFMLPNACFPLFPVIDYKTFLRNYYDDDAYRIYQLGVDWIVRGIIHLILYRLVYYHLTLGPEEVTDPSLLMQFLVSNFLLYLRVSGLFHLIIGMLYLFGFRLPETHNRYLLASSFTDFWRRINIYWKDFMQKVFYYPAVFKLRNLGTTKAMIVATLYVFLLTWFLHAYQWFWLRGTILFVLQDILFWAILGVLVVLNALYEMRYGRNRSLSKGKQTFSELCILTIKSFLTFCFICVLWSFWTTDSLTTWLSLWSALDGEYTIQVFLFPSIILVIIFIGNIERGSIRNMRSSEETNPDWKRERLVTITMMMLLIGISIQSVHVRLGTEVANLVHSLRSARLSRLDTANLERGYYENLLSVDRFNSQLWEVYTKKPTDWLISNAGLKQFTNDFAQYDMVPSVVLDTNYGTVSINRWGMRDKDYELNPDSNVYRIAMLGASSVMGWGVGDGETFEALIETRLNQENNANIQYEILNFGIQGYQPLQQLIAANKSLKFSPNAVFYVATGREISRSAAYLVEVATKGIDIPFEPLREIVKKAELTRGLEEVIALKQVKPYSKDILDWTYQYIAELARNNRTLPVLIFLPQVREGDWQEETAETLHLAEKAGFIVIDLSDIYLNKDITMIRLAEWDDHPNKYGHELIAERLYKEIDSKRGLIFNFMNGGYK